MVVMGFSTINQPFWGYPHIVVSAFSNNAGLLADPTTPLDAPGALPQGGVDGMARWVWVKLGDPWKAGMIKYVQGFHGPIETKQVELPGVGIPPNWDG